MQMTGAKTGAIFLVILCWGLMISGPSVAWGESETPDNIVGADCSVLLIDGLYLVADYFYADDPDRALAMILNIEGNCGSYEPLRRVKLLGSLWDASFTEDMYDAEIISDLAARANADNVDFRFAHFDSFTTDMADQLLPHVEKNSLEEFFCLFHAGRVDEAYILLQGDELQGTDLKYYYENELQYLDADRVFMVGGVFGSYWNSGGKLARLGDHAMAGVMIGCQYGDLFGRLNFGFRMARSQYPYYVDYDGETGWSDRTVGAKVTLDFGTCIFSRDRHEVGAFFGGGVDLLQPFNELDDYTISGLLALVGVEYKLWLGRHRLWNISLDVKKEWYGHWPGEGTDFAGDAWDFRVGIGIAPGNSATFERRENLGYR